MSMANHTHQHHSPGHHDHTNPFLIPFLLVLFFAIVEFAGGVWTQSLALLSDAWHMVSDVVALGLAMFAVHYSNKTKTNAKDSRSELFVSIVNAVLMLLVIGWIILEAIERFGEPKTVFGGYVMIIAFIGLLVNVVVARQLHSSEEAGSLNHRAAFIHVMGDLLGSIGALAAGTTIYFTGWLLIDPLLSLGISILLLVVTLSLIKDIVQTVSVSIGS